MDKLIGELKDLEQNFEPYVIEQVKPFEPEIVELNTEDQLYLQGIDGAGKKLEPAYRPLTLQLKRIKGQRVDHVTLQDEGDFHGAYHLLFQSTRFAIVNDDAKAAKLERKYGPDIFGLTDENVQEVRVLIREPFLEFMRKKLIK